MRVLRAIAAAYGFAAAVAKMRGWVRPSSCPRCRGAIMEHGVHNDDGSARGRVIECVDCPWWRPV